MPMTQLALTRSRLRVLLVEFINADQFPGQIQGTYPFVKGYLNFHRVPNAWLRFAIPADNQFRHGRDEITLEEPELARLAGRVKALDASIVFTSHPLFPEQCRRLQARFAGLRLAAWDPHAPLVLELLKLLEPGPTPARFEPVRLLDQPRITRDYRWEPGNEAAGRPDRNNVYLVMGAGCHYRKPVSANPCYRGVDLSPGVIAIGCAFCGHATPAEPTPVQTVRGWLTRQLRDVKRTLGPDRLPGAVIVENIVHMSLLEHILATLRHLGMERTALLVAARVDHLVAARPLLEAKLAKLQNRKEAIHLYTIGLENFSDPELDRFNKGFDSLTVVKAVNMLKELEVLYGRNFHYSGYMPLGLILFTPWTRLADLQRNIRLMQHFDLEYETGNTFMSRLRLHEHLPITALAAKDGLIVHDVEDALRLNRRKLFGYERAWRFADPRVEPVNRLAVRLESKGSFEGEPLFELMQSRLPRMNRKQRIAFLLCIVDAAAQSGAPLSAQRLLDRAVQLWKRRSEPVSRVPARWRLGTELLDLAATLERALPLVRSGDKPVLSLEGLDEKDLAGLDLPALRRRGLAVAVRETAGARALHVARRAPDLARLLRLERGAAAQGRLYGYPACCVRAWQRRAAGRVFDEWAALDWRLRTPGPVAAELGLLRAPDFSFVPCSADCAAARRTHGRWLAALKVPAPRDEVCVFSLEDRSQFASCLPTGADPRSIRYAPGSVQGAPGWLGDRLRQGDRIAVGPGETEVWKGRRLIGRWVAEVAVWDPRGAVDGEFWTELAKAAWRRQDPRWRERAERAAHDSKLMALDRGTAAGRAAAGIFAEPPVTSEGPDLAA